MLAACTPSRELTSLGKSPMSSSQPLTLQSTATRSLAPIPRPSATDVVEGMLSASSLRFRSGPGTDHPVVGGLLRDQCVETAGLSTDHAWVLITVMAVSPALQGWVAAEYLIISPQSFGLPEIAGQQPLHDRRVPRLPLLVTRRLPCSGHHPPSPAIPPPPRATSSPTDHLEVAQAASAPAHTTNMTAVTFPRTLRLRPATSCASHKELAMFTILMVIMTAACVNGTLEAS